MITLFDCWGSYSFQFLEYILLPTLKIKILKYKILWYYLWGMNLSLSRELKAQQIES